MWKHFIALLSILLLLGGCAPNLQTKPETAHETVQPTTQPVRTVTNFSDSLRCMDRLFLVHGVEPIYITSAGLPDMSAKGVVGNGARHMLISAISKMAAQSKSIVFVDLPSNPMAYANTNGVENPDLDILYKHLMYVLQETLKNNPHRPKFNYPDYYILGATSQVEDKVTSEGTGGSVGLAKADASLSVDQSVSIISLDMNIADATNFSILNGLTASNSIAVMRQSRNNEFGLGGILQKAGVYFNVALDKRQGPQQALRTLVELSSIELIGKLAQVPYWQCLQIEQTNPEMQSQAREWFAAMQPEQRIAFVQKTLLSKGFYTGSVSGVLDGATKDAISRYQANEGLIPSGRVDFGLYRILIGGELAQGRKPELDFQSTAGSQTRSSQPIKMQLRSSQSEYKLNDKFSFYLNTSSDAYVHCYYQGGDKNIIKVFPNQRQANPYIKAQQLIEVPAKQAMFEIILEHSNTQEDVMCLATHQDVSMQLPAELKVADIQPVQLSSLDEVKQAYEKLIAQPSLSYAKLNIFVE